MRNALVTGAASGIGKAVAQVLLEKGYRVMLTDMNEETLGAAQAEFEALFSGRVFAKAGNVASQDDMRAVCEEMQEKVGFIDSIANCAGIYRGTVLHETQEKDLEDCINVNLRGAFNTCKLLLPAMKEKRFGRIVNIVSVDGLRANYHACAYNVSKAALRMLTQCTALDYAEYGITCNSVSPSLTKSPRVTSFFTDEKYEKWAAVIPDHVIGETRMAANAAAFLLSDEASHINGHDLVVDGGLTVWNGEPK